MPDLADDSIRTDNPVQHLPPPTIHSLPPRRDCPCRALPTIQTDTDISRRTPHDTPHLPWPPTDKPFHTTSRVDPTPDQTFRALPTAQPIRQTSPYPVWLTTHAWPQDNPCPTGPHGRTCPDPYRLAKPSHDGTFRNAPSRTTIHAGPAPTGLAMPSHAIPGQAHPHRATFPASPARRPLDLPHRADASDNPSHTYQTVHSQPHRNDNPGPTGPSPATCHATPPRSYRTCHARPDPARQTIPGHTPRRAHPHPSRRTYRTRPDRQYAPDPTDVPYLPYPDRHTLPALTDTPSHSLPTTDLPFQSSPPDRPDPTPRRTGPNPTHLADSKENIKPCGRNTI